MELCTGLCGICSSSTLILNSGYSEHYCNLIYSHFADELNISSECKTIYNLCPTCVYQITLINSKKNLINRDDVEDELEVSDKCALCKQNGEIFKIADTNFKNKCKLWVPSREIISLCASCFYVIEVSNVLKEHLQKLLFKDDSTDNQNSLPKLRTILRRRKSTFEVGESSPKETKDTNSELNTCEERNSTNSNDSITSTPVKSKRRRSKNLEPLLDGELKNAKRSKRDSEQSEKDLCHYNLSSISHFSPLCKLDIHIDEKLKQDEKMCRSIPFVKMQHLPETIAEKDKVNYTCSLISQRPMIRVRRTPPIKIKTIKNLGASKGKKSSPVKTENKSASIETQPIDEIPKQKLVVKVERMKLNIPEEDISKEATSPKKKKRVHFNDTPTIIITEDDYYDDYRTRRNTRISPEKPDVEDEEEKVEEEKSDSEELITLTLEESDDETKKDTVIPADEAKTGESDDENKKSKVQASAEITQVMDAQSEKTEESKNEEINGETDELEEGEESSDRKGEDNAVNKGALDKKTEDAGEDEKDSLDDCQIMESEDNSENDEVDKKTEEDEKNSSDDCQIMEQEDNSENDKVVDKNTEETEEDDCQIMESEDNSENDKEVDKKTEETGEDDKDSLDDCQIIESEDNSEKDKAVDCLDDCQIENSENDTLVDEKTKKTGEAEGDHLQDSEIVEDSEDNKRIDNKKSEETGKVPQDKESKDESIEETGLKKTIDLQKKESENKSAEKIEKDLEDETNDVRETCPDENEDTEKTVEDSETEKDSLDGFEVIDQDDDNSVVQSTEKVSSNKEESTDDIDEIESLVRKYCEEKDAENDNPEKEKSDRDKKDEENVLDIGAESSSEKNNCQEEKENNSNKQNSEQESVEGFGPLIDEVQKCLTSTKDSINKTEEGKKEDQGEVFIPNAIELAEILNSSFDEDTTDAANSSQTGSVNGNKGLKRKNSDEKSVMSDEKREKIDIS